MNKIGRLFILLSMVIASSCSSPAPTLPLWLEGTWETGKTDGFAAEVWRKVNDTLMSGDGWIGLNGEISIMEEFSIFISHGKVYYSVTVLEQNNREEIIYECIESVPGQMVFENPEHDYPTLFRYTWVGNSLTVTTSGREKDDDVIYEMKKNEQKAN
jgi:hypothetical protein